MSMLEYIKWMNEREIRNTLITTDAGWIAYRRWGLARQHGFHVVKVYTLGEERMHPIHQYIRRIRKFYRILPALNPQDGDTIICNNEMFVNAIPARALARKNHNVRCLYWWHKLLTPNLRDTRNLYGLWWAFTRWFYPKTMRKGGVVLTTNPTYMEAIQKRTRDQYVYCFKCYSGSASSRKPILGEHKVYDMVWVGRMTRGKGVCDILLVHRHLRGAGIPCKLAVIGDGDKMAEFQCRVNVHRDDTGDLGIDLLGCVSDKLKWEVMLRSKVCVITSYAESYCTLMIEAMAMGLPVVAYEVGHFRDLFGGGGLMVVKTGDTEAMAGVIKGLLDNANHRFMLADQSYRFAGHRTWADHATEIHRLTETAPTTMDYRKQGWVEDLP